MTENSAQQRPTLPTGHEILAQTRSMLPYPAWFRASNLILFPIGFY
jgi:hypothetical protein